MNFNQLLVIAAASDRARAQPLTQAVLDDWAGAPAPKVRWVDPAEAPALDAQLKGFDAAWVFAGPDTPDLSIQQAIIALRQWQLPVLLSSTASDEPAGLCWQEGVVIGPPDAPTTQTRLVLQSLVSQGQTLRELKAELSLHKKSRQGVVDQIDKLDEELRLAARIQREFLPQALPTLPGVGFDVLYRPAGYVSGDTYDVTQLDEHRVAFYVADAVGHGVPAALLTMLIKQSIRTPERRLDHAHVLTPADVLARLNADLLRRTTGRVQFVTAAYGVLDVRTGELVISRAGHPAPFILKPDGTIIELEPEGPLLGVFEEAEFEMLTTTLERGDRLLVYSDGFELAFGDAEKAVNERYIDELHALREGTCRDALGRLEDALDTASGSLHQRDDLTALLVDIAADRPEQPVDNAERRRSTGAPDTVNAG